METPLRAIPSMPGTELHLPSTPLRSDSNRGSCPTTPDLMNLVQVRGPRTRSIDLHNWFELFGNPWSRSTLLPETNSLKYTTSLKGFGSLYSSLFYPRYKGLSKIVPPYIRDPRTANFSDRGLCHNFSFANDPKSRSHPSIG